MDELWHNGIVICLQCKSRNVRYSDRQSIRLFTWFECLDCEHIFCLRYNEGSKEAIERNEGKYLIKKEVKDDEEKKNH